RESARVEELTLGYRVAESIMQVASRVLAVAAPALQAPKAVRREPGEVVMHDVSAGEMAATVVREAREMQAAVGTAAVIAPRQELDAIREAFVAAGADFGDAEAEGMDHPVTLVPVDRCKGLEFDGVVLVEPQGVVEAAGLRMLYVAITRAMRRLSVVHTGPLPPFLGSGTAASGRQLVQSA
ncbi:MAG TPA: ATP-binding domain-containing protein, partial [Actinomycetota bacterium]|nr:ATP-binding domain-containing protein [Actinomycetota bacterium]